MKDLIVKFLIFKFKGKSLHLLSIPSCPARHHCLSTGSRHLLPWWWNSVITQLSSSSLSSPFSIAVCIFKTLILSNHSPSKNKLLTPHTKHLVGSVIPIYGTYFLRDSKSQCPGQDQAQRTLILTVLPQVVKLFQIQMPRSKPGVKVLASQRLEIENCRSTMYSCVQLMQPFGMDL